MSGRPYAYECPGDPEDFITCPECGFVDEETADYPRGMDSDGDVVEYTCPECDAGFCVQLHVSYAFEALRPKVGPRHLPYLAGRRYVGVERGYARRDGHESE